MKLRWKKTTTNGEIIEVDFTAIEHHIMATTLIQMVETKLAMIVGAKETWEVHVFFTPNEIKPPTLQRAHPKAFANEMMSRGPRNGRTRRRIVVGKEWLRLHEPSLWALIVGARLLDGSTFPTLKRHT